MKQVEKVKSLLKTAYNTEEIVRETAKKAVATLLILVAISLTVILGTTQPAKADEGQQSFVIPKISTQTLWKNTRGSYLIVENITDGKISGGYVSCAKGFTCQGIKVPVTGWVDQDVDWVEQARISFTANFAKSGSPPCANSVTGWTGYNLGENIFTLWHLATKGYEMSDTLLAGEDYFTKQRDYNPNPQCL